MPYPTKKALPKQLQGLPSHAKGIWQKAFNNSYKKHGEDRARKIAWSAVKNVYKKEKEGKWVRKEKKVKGSFLGHITDIYKMSKGAKIPDVQEVELLREGHVQHPEYGEFNITKGDLFEMSNNASGREVVIQGHEFDNMEKPASGWIKEMNVNIAEDGVAVLKGSVEWNEKGRKALKNKEFRFISPEFDLDFVDPETQETKGAICHQAALTNKPYFSKLKPIVASKPKSLNNFLSKSQMKKKDKKTLSKKGKKKASMKKEAKKGVISNKDNTVTLPMKKFSAILDALDGFAKQGKTIKKLNQKMRMSEMETQSKKLVFSSVNPNAVFFNKKDKDGNEFKAGLATFMASLNSNQLGEFLMIMETARVDSKMFSELGSAQSEGDDEVKVEKRTEDGTPISRDSSLLARKTDRILASYAKDGKKLAYGKAMRIARDELVKEGKMRV